MRKLPGSLPLQPAVIRRSKLEEYYVKLFTEIVGIGTYPAGVLLYRHLKGLKRNQPAWNEMMTGTLRQLSIGAAPTFATIFPHLLGI